MMAEFIQSKNMGKKDVKKKPTKASVSKSSAKSKDKIKESAKEKVLLKKSSPSASKTKKKLSAKSIKPLKKTVEKAAEKLGAKRSSKGPKTQKVKVNKAADKKRKLTGKSHEESSSSDLNLKKKISSKNKLDSAKLPKKQAKKSQDLDLPPEKKVNLDGESPSLGHVGVSVKKSSEASGEEAKTSSQKKGPKAKKSEESGDLDDVGFISDEIGDDEIGEYAEELKAVEEMDSETDDVDSWILDGKDRSDTEIVLTDAEGRRYCRSRDCDQIAMVDGYCRYHYLLFWKKIQIRKKILADGKLEKYVEELTSRYPDKFLEMIRRDLRTEKDFLSAIQELEIDEGAIENEFEEDAQAFIEEVRVMGESANIDDDDY